MCRSRASYKLIFKIILACCVALIYLQFQLLSSADRNRLVHTLQFKSDEYIPEIVDWKRACNASKYAEQPDLQNYDFETKKAGYLNVLLWENISGFSVNSFLTQPLFPRQPSKFLVAPSAFVKIKKAYYGQWIVGYLHVDITGEYRFALSSDDSSEFWISTDERAENVRRVAQVGDGYAPGWTSLGQHAKYVNQVSDQIILQKCKKYFIQVVHKQAVGDGFVAVSWNRAGSQSFHIITGAYLLPLMRMSKHLLTFIPPVGEQFKSLNAAFKMQRENKLSLESPAEYIDTQRLDRTLIQSAIGTCPLQKLRPVRNSTPNITQGSQQLITDVYPGPWAYKIKDKSNDNTFLKALQGKRAGILSKKKAKAVVRKFMTLMEERNPRRFQLESINAVEHKKYHNLRDVYLVDLTLKDNTRQIKPRSASYVYKSWVEDSLCVPDELDWNENVLVQVIVIVAKAEHGKWAISLIDNIEDIYRRTANNNIQVTIVHYGPKVLDVEGVLSATSLPRHIFIPRTEAFSFAKAIQEALDAIVHEKTISLLVDPYVKLPLDIFDQTRKEKWCSVR
ncbi:uncharacterized protein LOC116300193 isoform X2 [Actinia tenebrosa]|uniref:Uncharacterized protein LOC116300193 isoform X2 n=1 Tax=Actinia tenebrosa TaxID=6105 RepID=A0A6P8IBU8_ACTTE|nr:uncharacterized protein LOC116300193 isoform X2 [Actinia tenebrosa]